MTTTSTSQALLAEFLDLRGRTAIVTGGAMGIGLGIVHRLHHAGANVLIADLDIDAAQGTAENLIAARPGGRLLALKNS